MKKIKRVYDPYSRSVDFSFTGPTLQSYGPSSKEYYPDRSIIPLVVSPTLYFINGKVGSTPQVVDADSISGIEWTVRTKAGEQIITSANSDYSIETTGANKGQLTVYKNTVVNDPAVYTFNCNVTDKRNNTAIPVTLEFNTSTDERAESINELKMTYHDGTLVSLFDPINTTLHVTAEMTRDMEKIEGTKYWWYFKNDEMTNWVLIDSTHNVEITNNGEDLFVPLNFIGKSCLFTVYAEKTTASSPSSLAVSKEFALAVTVPKYEVTINAPNCVVYDIQAFKLSFEVTYSNGTLQNPGNVFNIDWMMKKADESITNIGSTQEITSAPSEFGNYEYAEFGVSLDPKFSRKLLK